ncbi:hypothetical protein [Pseudoduganella lutea]|uniref:hypothetical protein n=1 Tax=Pseudoduganella lutea TaxID=321985 RepID=UPI0013EEA4DC|nr:hypothetical protein [Pseudoduganella lutea]
MLVDEDQIGALYQYQWFVEAAALIICSDFATIQRYDHDRDQLELIARIGLNAAALKFW